MVASGYGSAGIDAAFNKTLRLAIARSSILVKITKTPPNRVVLTILFDKSLGNISGVLRHVAVLGGQGAKEFMPGPPMLLRLNSILLCDSS